MARQQASARSRRSRRFRRARRPREGLWCPKRIYEVARDGGGRWRSSQRWIGRCRGSRHGCDIARTSSSNPSRSGGRADGRDGRDGSSARRRIRWSWIVRARRTARTPRTSRTPRAVSLVEREEQFLPDHAGHSSMSASLSASSQQPLVTSGHGPNHLIWRVAFMLACNVHTRTRTRTDHPINQCSKRRRLCGPHRTASTHPYRTSVHPHIHMYVHP